jgi:two-component system chemotaxis response regulator CheB
MNGELVDSQALQVLVVDDSALMRNLVSRIIDAEPDMQVAAKAMNGKFALSKLENLTPDVIILDLEMPEMNGVEFLKQRRTLNIDIPVIVLSAVAQKGASITMEALAAGAVDFIPKPTGQDPEEIRTIGSQLVELVRSYGIKQRKLKSGAPLGRKSIPSEGPSIATQEPTKQKESVARTLNDVTRDPSRQPTRKRSRTAQPGPLELIAFGISTGGPNALRQVFSKFPSALKVPMLVVQHMPAGFTNEFAKSLDRICPLEVKEAQDGDLVKPGRILIAPGDYHLVVEKKSLATLVRLDSSPSVSGHRPSADVLFESVAKVYGNRAMGVIMTGMGKDGADKIGDIYEAGGYTLGQDQESSVVYGMPRVAFEYGYVMEQVSLDSMADRIFALVNELS